MASMTKSEADAYWARFFHDKAKRLEAEVTRQRAKLQIATDGLGTIADRGGEDWQVADRALTRMQEVE